jgi:hypothetical protein
VLSALKTMAAPLGADAQRIVDRVRDILAALDQAAADDESGADLSPPEALAVSSDAIRSSDGTGPVEATPYASYDNLRPSGTTLALYAEAMAAPGAVAGAGAGAGASGGAAAYYLEAPREQQGMGQVVQVEAAAAVVVEVEAVEAGATAEAPSAAASASLPPPEEPIAPQQAATQVSC